MRGRGWVLLGAAWLAMPACAAPYQFRELSIEAWAEGQQQWRNEPQWASASLRHHYRYSISLRSPGKLEGASLLDPDPQRRIALRAEYLRRNGLAQLKAAGFDTEAPDLAARVAQRQEQQSAACQDEPDCLMRISLQYSTLLAIAQQPDNSQLFAGPPRYLFFFGYPGCRNQVQAQAELHLRGEATRTQARGQLKPYVVEVQGQSSGSAQEQARLCEQFTVVLDTRTQRLSVDNVYLPAAWGQTHRELYGHADDSLHEVPIVPGLQGWAQQQLREAPLSGERSETLPLTLPPDGDGSLLGRWQGQGRFRLRWSFVPAAN